MADATDGPFLILNGETFDLPVEADGTIFESTLLLFDQTAAGLKYK